MLLKNTEFEGRKDCPFFKTLKDGKEAKNMLDEQIRKMEEKLNENTK